MRTNLLIIFTVLWSFLCDAKTNEMGPKNSLSVELGKTGLIYNLNYDHKFGGKKAGLRFAIGSNLVQYLNALVIGGGGYQLFGKKGRFLEAGLDLMYLQVDEVSDDQKGFVFVYPDYTVKASYTSLNIGYRRYGEKTLFRIGFSPGLIKKEFVPGGYIGFGLTF